MFFAKVLNMAKRVFVVDDEQPVLDLVKELLVGAKYNVEVYPDGEGMIKALAKGAPDLILLDIKLPGMDGYKVCKTLKSNPHMAELKICFISAKTTPDDVRKGLDCGADDYLTKPFSNSQLIAKVRELVGK